MWSLSVWCCLAEVSVETVGVFLLDPAGLCEQMRFSVEELAGISTGW